MKAVGFFTCAGDHRLIPSQTTPAPATYSDTIVATVTYRT